MISLSYGRIGRKRHTLARPRSQYYTYILYLVVVAIAISKNSIFSHNLRGGFRKLLFFLLPEDNNSCFFLASFVIAITCDYYV